MTPQLPLGVGRDALLNAVEGLRAATLAEIGISVVSNRVVAQDLEEREIVQLLADWEIPTLDIRAIFPAGRRPTARARLFTEWLVEQLVSADPPAGLSQLRNACKVQDIGQSFDLASGTRIDVDAVGADGLVVPIVQIASRIMFEEVDDRFADDPASYFAEPLAALLHCCLAQDVIPERSAVIEIIGDQHRRNCGILATGEVACAERIDAESIGHGLSGRNAEIEPT